MAVAYDTAHYLGKIVNLKNEEEIVVNFLSKRKDGSYKWPKQKDTDKVSAKYIFCSSPRVQKIGTDFVVSNLESIEQSYQSYHKKYMLV